MGLRVANLFALRDPHAVASQGAGDWQVKENFVLPFGKAAAIGTYRPVN